MLSDIEAFIAAVQAKNYLLAVQLGYKLLGEILKVLNAPGAKVAHVDAMSVPGDLDTKVAYLQSLVTSSKSATVIPWQTILSIILSILPQILPLL